MLHRLDEFWQTPTGMALRCLPDFNHVFLLGGTPCPQALWLPHPWWWLSSTCCCRVSGGPKKTSAELGFEAQFLVGQVFQVLIAMAKFERSLSNNDLNKSMMQKIFLAQTLNIGTGWITFLLELWMGGAYRWACGHLFILCKDFEDDTGKSHPVQAILPKVTPHCLFRQALFCLWSIPMGRKVCSLDAMAQSFGKSILNQAYGSWDVYKYNPRKFINSWEWSLELASNLGDFKLRCHLLPQKLTMLPLLPCKRICLAQIVVYM